MRDVTATPPVTPPEPSAPATEPTAPAPETPPPTGVPATEPTPAASAPTGEAGVEMAVLADLVSDVRVTGRDEQAPARINDSGRKRRGGRLRWVVMRAA